MTTTETLLRIDADLNVRVCVGIVSYYIRVFFFFWGEITTITAHRSYRANLKPGPAVHQYCFPCFLISESVLSSPILPKARTFIFLRASRFSSFHVCFASELLLCPRLLRPFVFRLMTTVAIVGDQLSFLTCKQWLHWVCANPLTMWCWGTSNVSSQCHPGGNICCRFKKLGATSFWSCCTPASVSSDGWVYTHFSWSVEL